MRTYTKRAEHKPEILRRVVARVGNASKLAHALDIAPSAVAQWKRVPERHVVKVSEMTGISVRELRPDLARLVAVFIEQPATGEAA